MTRETTIPLLESRNALADSAGTARIEITTPTGHEYWRVRTTVITTRTVGSNDPDTGPEFRLYRDTDNNSGLIDMSFNATDDVSDTVYDVHPGRRIIALFTGMETGNEATIRLEGDRVMKGDRGY